MINWKDIQDKAVAFVHEWRDTKEEDKWAKAFWVRFFDIFDVRERSLGIFEERVKLLKGGSGKIDFFAPNNFIIEHKTLGKDLDSAFLQAADYMDALAEDEKPRYIIVSDFQRFRIYDLEAPADRRITEFTLAELPQRVQKFAFLTAEEIREYKEEDPINVRAVRAIGKLYEALKTSNYPVSALPHLLTRLVFCFFADDTDIFNRNALRRYLEENTKADGSDIGAHLMQIFEVLNTPDGSAGSQNERQSTLNETLAALPWVNGGLFADPIPTVFGSRSVRDMIIKCVEFNWSRISPAIFGSMFQSVMNEKERHDLGAHYTSEQNILKVINGLFLEELEDELAKAATNQIKLNALWEKIAAITLLDPACGCGNFLVISYRELRRIELEIIKRLYKGSAKIEAGHVVLPLEVDFKKLSKLSVERMYGIEIEAFPAEIAKLSLWLMDHMMNVELGEYFGKAFRKLPLKEQPHIVQGNALQLDWKSVVPKEKLTYILGNPPFIAKQDQSKEQKADMLEVFGKKNGIGELDYVCAWYKKAVEYMQGTNIACAFVSTNSISQGEQPGILWNELFKLGAHIIFAYRTFKWSNEAQGKAAVHCVIIGFALSRYPHPKLWTGDQCSEAQNINPYLVDAPNVVVLSRRKPISEVPPMLYGSKPADGGFLILSNEEKQQVTDTIALKYIKPLLSAKEYLNNEKRWCLWLVDGDPADMQESPFLRERVASVRRFRELSTKVATQKLAQTPYLFAEIRQPKSDFVLVPLTSSENRQYVPMSFFSKDVIVSNTCSVLPNANLFHFGVIQSAMHMEWMRGVCGRLELRYRYSNELVYNNFPWPVNPIEAQKKAVEEAAQAVLDTRAKYPNSTLADLYDPNTMPADLLKAHHTLDRAVDACYGKKSFKSEPERLEFLFGLYKALIVGTA